MALKQEGPRAIEEDKRQGIFTRWDPNVSMKGIGNFLRALISCLHPVRACLRWTFQLELLCPLPKLLQLIVFGSLSNPFADRISVAD